MKPVTVNVLVYCAKGLKSKTGKHKFCVHVKVGKSKQKTNISEDLFGNPSFNKEFIFSTDSLNRELKLKVTEKNDKDVLGQVVVQLTDLCQEKTLNPEKVPLRVHKKCPTPVGELVFDAWVTGPLLSQMDLAKNSTSIESLKSLGSLPNGLKTLKEKLHSSVLKLQQSSKGDKNADVKNSHLSIFGGNGKSKKKLFSLKSRSSVSCQDLSGNSKDLKLTESIIEDPFHRNELLEESDAGIEKFQRDSFSSLTESLPPEVTGLSPKTGDSRGGTLLTIRGTNLGHSQGDVLHVYVCGIDVIESLNYVSSSKLICTTRPCIPCSGNVVVETRSGGLGSSTIEFSFIDFNRSSFASKLEFPEMVGNETKIDSPELNSNTSLKSLDINNPNLNQSLFTSPKEYTTKSLYDESKQPVPHPRSNSRAKDLGVNEEYHRNDLPTSEKIMNSDFESSFISKTAKPSLPANDGSDKSIGSLLSALRAEVVPASSSISRNVIDTESRLSAPGVYSLEKNKSNSITVSKESLEKKTYEQTDYKSSLSTNQKPELTFSQFFYLPESTNEDAENLTKSDDASRLATDLKDEKGDRLSSTKGIFNEKDGNLSHETDTNSPIIHRQPAMDKAEQDVVFKNSEDKVPGKLENKHVSNVSFSIAGDSSSDEELAAKKFKNLPPQDRMSVTATVQKGNFNDELKVTQNSSIHGYETISSYLNSSKNVVAAIIEPVMKTTEMQSEQVLVRPVFSRQGTETVNQKFESDGSKFFSNKNVLNDSHFPADKSAAVIPVPVKPPRVKELAELDAYDRQNQKVSMHGDHEQQQQPQSIYTSTNKNENDSTDQDRLRDLQAEIIAKDASLRELRSKNKSLQEERNLLRKYIEVLISRALATCPEILCRDDGKLSLN